MESVKTVGQAVDLVATKLGVTRHRDDRGSERSPRVVVTGIGPVTPVGTGVQDLGRAHERRNGVREISGSPPTTSR